MIRVNAINYECINDGDEHFQKIEKLDKKIASDFFRYVNHSTERDRFNDKKGLLVRNKHGELKRKWNGENKNYKPFWDGITGSVYTPDLDMTVCLRNSFDEKNKLYFLTHLIMAAFDIPDELPRFALYDAPLNEENILHFLYVFKLKQSVIEAYQTGFYRRYENFSANDDRVRGVIDVPRHIRLNAGLQNGCIAYNYRERTPDNYINHLIIQTCEYMRKKYPDLFGKTMTKSEDFETVLAEMKAQCPSWNNMRISELLKRSADPIPHPLYENFDKLRILCRRIWENEGLAFSGDGNESISSQSALFYLPDLWEAYLEKRILPQLPPEYTVTSQETLNSKKRPDFVVYRGGVQTAIFDAKFKSWYYEHSVLEKDKTAYHCKSEKEDRDQVDGYMKETNCRKGALIFPFRAENAEINYSVVNTTRQEFDPASMRFLFYIGLNVPPILADQSFFEWRMTMLPSEKALIQKLVTFLRA